MKNFTIILSLLIGIVSVSFAQDFGAIKGTLLNANNGSPIKGANVIVRNTKIFLLSDNSGSFYLTQVPVGNQIVVISLDGFETQSFPVSVKSGETIDLGNILMYIDFTFQEDTGLISLTDNDLSEDGNGGSENTSGILQASRDAFLNVAAFQFGQARFRVRGYDSNNGTVLINGIEMNKFYDGRPQWGNWGGLNDVMRNRDFKSGLSPNQYTFGGLLGTTNFDVRASAYRKGISLSVAATNTNYSNRLMSTYVSGMNEKGWAYTISIGRRWAEEGHFDGTFYDANSFFIAVEKKINDKHSLNLTAFNASNRRGKSSPNTAELFDLKGSTYNTYWGFQGCKKRNSRVKDIEEPVFILTDF